MLAHTVLPESYAPGALRHLDLVGAGISAMGLLALLLALTQANATGWTSPRTIVLFIVAALCSVVFIRHEGHTQAPLLDLSLFKKRSFAGANLVILLTTSVMCSLSVHRLRPTRHVPLAGGNPIPQG